MKKILAFLWWILFSCGFVFANDIPTLILFYGETCPHCKNEEWYIAELQDKYEFNLEWYEVYYDTDNQKLMEKYAEQFWENFNGVPLVIMWNDYFLWESYEKTEELLKKYAQLKIVPDSKKPTSIEIENQDIQPTELTGNQWIPEIEVTNFDFTGDETIWIIVSTWDTENDNQDDQTLKLLGKEISLKSVGPVVFWMLLGFVDGINPCMFWVLIFLLTYLVSVGSKKKVLYSGLIFVITTFVLYFAIMYLMHKVIFSTMALLPYIAYIKFAIGIIAIILGIIEVKDFFFAWKWISLKIPAAVKPTLEYITKKGTYMSAFVLAVLSTFVELPCTIWIPLAYVWAVWENINILLALWIYNLFFIIPLLIIVFGIYYWLSAFKTDENWNMAINDSSSKKIMRLVAGLVLILLWILFITKVI